MTKCDKCGREYSAEDVKTIRDKKSRDAPQPKSDCPWCDKGNKRRGFLKDTFKRLTK